MSILKYNLRNIDQIGGSDKVTFRVYENIDDLNKEEQDKLNQSNTKCFGNLLYTNNSICILKLYNQIIAYCVLDKNTIWSVCKTIQGQKYKGTCKRLIAEVINYCKNKNMEELFLHVRVSGKDNLGNEGENISAIKCYESNQFKFVDPNRSISIVQDNENLSKMKLNLNNINEINTNLLEIKKLENHWLSSYIPHIIFTINLNLILFFLN
jgi:citrate lyase synthetase